MQESVSPKIISVNIGLPRVVEWKGRQVETGIFKEPVDKPLMLRRLNFDGDRQADLTVHGGADKAVYAYPAEHYLYWRQLLTEQSLPWGMFGENLSTEGLNEETVYIGERFKIGQAVLMATQPRMPCYKLGLKFGRPEIVRQFLASRRTGFYFAVLEEGLVAPGDTIERLDRPDNGVNIAVITELYVQKKPDPALLSKVIEQPGLAESWRTYFEEQLIRA
ncbi:MAG TPA: MOSC domain-containing protein [Chloroflexia bacterium]|nr:MOSC domain-containing protein [Chloroflexia bacterium]